MANDRDAAELQFKQHLDAAQKLTREDFLQSERMGKVSFLARFATSADDLLLEINRLTECDPKVTPVNKLVALNASFTNLFNAQKRLQSVRPETFQNINGPTFIKRQEDELAALFQEFNSAAGSVIAFGGMRSPTTTAEISAIEARELLEEIQRLRQAAAKSAQGAAEAAGETGSSVESQHFDELSNRHSRSASFWLVFTVLIALLIVVIALWHFYNPYAVNAENKWIDVQRIVAKIIILSTLSFVLVFFLRNYNTSRHNHIVNEQRAKALKTFKAFVAGAGNDEETKNAVLLQACRAVYQHQTSGYLRKDGDPGGIAIFDWMKALMK